MNGAIHALKHGTRKTWCGLNVQTHNLQLIVNPRWTQHATCKLLPSGVGEAMSKPAIWKVALALAAYTLLATMPVCKLLGPTLGPGAWLAGAVISSAAGEVFARRWHPAWRRSCPSD